MKIARIVLHGSVLTLAAAAAGFRVPASNRYAYAAANTAETVLPGGRVLQAFGQVIETGPGTSALAVDPKGLVAAGDTGPERFGVTVIEPPAKGPWRTHHVWARTPSSRLPELADPDWKSVADGLAFESDHALWVSEGASGRVRLIDANTGNLRKLVRVSRAPSPSGYTGALALDASRRLLYVLDTDGDRLVAIDTRTARIRSEAALGGRPKALALAENGQTAWITTSSPDGSLLLADLRDPAKLRLLDPLRAGGQPGKLLAGGGRVFVSDPRDDSVVVLSQETHEVTERIPLRIGNLSDLRGILPAGLAFDPVSNWLLVAESGINAVGVIDLAAGKLIGHIPAGWMPVSLAISGDRVYVANKNGRGTGPNLKTTLPDATQTPSLHHGSVTTFVMPAASELAALTEKVLASNGFTPDSRLDPPLPVIAGHVVLITCEPRSFDEALGDIIQIGPQRVTSFGPFARFGLHGLAIGASGQFSLHDTSVTPNFHKIAQLWAFSDNYYSEAEPPESEDAAPVLTHVQRNGVASARYDSAARFLEDLERRTRSGRNDLPPFVSIDLPRPSVLSGRFPYEASFAASTDLTVGRILDALSHSPWWSDMAVLVAASGAPTGLDHIDSHRTLLLAAGPFVKRGYLSRTNASFPSVVRTALELLGLPPMGLRDAVASDLRDFFTDVRNNSTFTALAPDPRLFEAQ